VWERNVEAVSKPGVEAAVSLGFASDKGCRSCRSEAAGRVEAYVEGLSKRANFDGKREAAGVASREVQK
jgi:hypothetical protein